MTVGIADVVEQVRMAGTLAFGSKGVTVFAPETANSSALAAVGVPLRETVITSDESAVEAMPYHSVWVVSCVLVHAEYAALAELCQATASDESLTEETGTELPERKVTIQSTITSFVAVVEALTEKEAPVVQLPIALPSRARVVLVELGSAVCVSTDRQGDVHPVTGGAWFSK